VTKQFSKLSTELAQQLDQLDGSSEGKLNELLDRLEAERERIPVEDRPIIDWGISITRAKLLEQEKWMQEMVKDLKELTDKYENYGTFIKASGWKRGIKKNDWYDSCAAHVDEIVGIARDQEVDVADIVGKLGKYMCDFCYHSNVTTPQTAIQTCISYANEHVGNLKDSSNKDYNLDLARIYENIELELIALKNRSPLQTQQASWINQLRGMFS
jgi:hypothetical protein